jgi:hypothetical protein
MAVDRAVLDAAVREHMRAERDRDMDALRVQLHEDVDYFIKSPAVVGDPTPHGHFIGRETYISMWERLYTIFSSYDIEIEDTVLDPERGHALVRLQITAVPVAEWRGLPAGQAVRWWPAAVCAFDEDGRMLSETVYGSFPPTMDGYDRMREYARTGQPAG